MNQIKGFTLKFWHYINRQRIEEINTKTRINMDEVCSGSILNDRGDGELFNLLENGKIIFHCYWYGAIGRKQVASIESLLATQKNYNFEVWLWIDEETKNLNGQENAYLESIRPLIQIKYYNPRTVKTVKDFSKVYYLFEDNKNLARRADGFRLYALHEFGGFYFDLDIMFLRDMKNLLLGPEFVYAWERQMYANNAIIYFRKNSYINEYIGKKIRRIHSTQPWALFDYKDKKLKSLRLIPATVFDPIWNNDSETFPIHRFEEFFSKTQEVEKIGEIFPFSYAYHWHNHWNDEINESSLFAILERRNKEIIKNEQREKDIN